MKKFWITFNFYASDHFKKKSLIILALFLLAPIGIFFAIDAFGGGSYDEVAVVQVSSEFIIPTDMFTGLERVNVHFMDYTRARTSFDEGLVSDVFIIGGIERPELEVWSDSLAGHGTVHWMIENTLASFHLEALMNSYDLPAEVISQVIAPVVVEVEVADIEDLIAVELVNGIVPFIVLMVVTMTGQMVANSVASEKTSRVMEVMLGKVHPTYTMVSKVLSSFVGMILPILAMGLGVVIAHFAGLTDMSIVGEIINDFIPMTALALIIVVILLGYFCYIFLFAAAGAIANSVESLSSTLAPITYMLMIPFFLTMFLDMNGTIANILVYVPFISPFMLVQRYLLGTSGLIEVAIVIILMAAFAIFSLIISARLYMNGISHTAEKVSLGDLRKMLVK